MELRYTVRFALDLHLQILQKHSTYFNPCELYFELKFPPSPSKTNPPRYSADLMFGTPQQTEVQQLGRIVSLFFELLFHLERFLLKSQRHIKNNKTKFSGIQILG